MCLMLLFVFAFTFAATVNVALADGEALCECVFWCDCEGSYVGGEWYQPPVGEKYCTNSETNLNCVCHVCK